MIKTYLFVCLLGALLGSVALFNPFRYKGAKRACPAPLKDITFKRHVVHKKKKEKVQRQAVAVSAPTGGDLDDIKVYVDAIKRKEPSLLWCKNVGQAEPPRFLCPILDNENLHSEKCREHFRKEMESVRPLSLSEVNAIQKSTFGQGKNPTWKRERVGRLTASNFKRMVRCKKPESLVREVMYPKNIRLKPGDPRLYGIENEPLAVDQYVQLMAYYDKEVHVEETGLHVYPRYPFIAASPDRIVYDGEGVGLLEVKCPRSKKGQTPKGAALDKKFFAHIVEGEVTLKRDSAYYYQVQGQLAVTGLRWADFVIWTNNGLFCDSISVERIAFDNIFWYSTILPGLLYFYERVVIPERITRRVRRLGRMHTTEPGHVPHEMHVAGFYIARMHENPLKLTFERVK
ncbi:uncharacterized protein LOC120840811 [Ixodes scapularis]|uniref:uncharacterized protein LOC120840811 n=1 Tax=Ixodes scapularis TaxID=6945 RepID=UPI001A9E6609|nr:uncharacterized protein LOC120840811 [Ixodes scapularis]